MWLLCWTVLFLVALGLQWRSQAYSSDLGGDPDEAAHAVTSLMVRDYLFQAPGSHPLRFAEDYYERMPKVALGHYPPGFYALAGLWLAPLVSIKSLLLLQAVLLASLGTLTAWFASRVVSLRLGAAVGLLVCLAPPIQKLTSLVMSDLLLALVCLVAAIAMAKFVERPGKGAALAFGFAAAAAILIKGSGLMLALVPPLVIAFTGQWRVILRPVLWLAPLPVLLFAFPWQLFSYKFTKEGMSGLTVGRHFQKAFAYYGEAAERNVGWPFAILLGVMLALALVRRLRGQLTGATEASLWALLLAGLVLVFTVPAGMSPRYLVPLIAPAFAVAVLVVASTGHAAQPKLHGWVGWVAAGTIAVSLWLTRQVLPTDKNVHGYSHAVQVMSGAEAPVEAKQAWLVCSDARGEGAVIAAAAFDPAVRQRRGLRVLRATKELATMDWLGRDYAPAFADDAALLEHLKKQAVTQVVIDDSVAESARMPYYTQLSQVLARPDSGFRLQETVPAQRGREQGPLRVYSRVP
ncbi:MAG: hypothetical protein ACAI34_00575 [Verrucomicrobium sp.]|nr:hypothetical protein [Verrucomicrobium sp.]